MTEAEAFDKAMSKLLTVPPQIVKNAMEQEKRERAIEREKPKEQK